MIHAINIHETSRVSLAEVLQDVRENALQALEQHELKQRLWETIDALPIAQKAVIIETEFEGRAFQELSSRWNVPIGTLLARKSRGMQAIRAAFEVEKPKMILGKTVVLKHESRANR